MKTKKFFSLLISLLLCLSCFTAFAEDVEISLDGDFFGNDASQQESSQQEDFRQEEDSFTDGPKEEYSSQNDEDCIDYSDMENWAFFNEGSDKQADLFIVCPTVDMGKDGRLIADINDEKYRESFVGALRMELGIYSGVSSVYAPYYRQATFPVYSLSEQEREEYLNFAYEDIKDAFLYYADNCDESKPLILAGFSQGSDLVTRLIKDLFDEPKYARRLVAAYCPGWKLTEDEVKEFPHLIPAKGEADTGVIISFNSEAKDVISSIVVAENEKTYAINPLNWKTDSTIADKSENLGACFTDYSGSIKNEIPNLTGAYIDEKRGTLKVTDIPDGEYESSLFDKGVYHLYDYQFFFKNLKENVKVRLDAFIEENADRITVKYDGEIMAFDVEPIIMDARTLVPFRAIFEIMGCEVGYFADETGVRSVSARRGKNTLMMSIGEPEMYYNGKAISLDVPAIIKDSRTLVPIRAITEAFECEVSWDNDTRTVSICPPAGHFKIKAECLTEKVTDNDGNVLIEISAYYPFIENSYEIPFVDEINEEYKWNAEEFVKDAKSEAQAAQMMLSDMGKERFIPYSFSRTFETSYNISGTISIIEYSYVNTGGAHPTTAISARTFNTSLGQELPLSEVLEEQLLEDGLIEYVARIFAEKLKETGFEPDGVDAFDYVYEVIGYVQFYLTRDSVVLYFNQGDIAPYAAGVISVEIPYDENLFFVDMRNNSLEKLILEHENDKGYEWVITGYSDDKLTISEEYKAYPAEELESEYYPVGMKTVTATAKEQGNAYLALACIEEGGDISTAVAADISIIYIDENNLITVVTGYDDVTMLSKFN